MQWSGMWRECWIVLPSSISDPWVIKFQIKPKISKRGDGGKIQFSVLWIPIF